MHSIAFAAGDLAKCFKYYYCNCRWMGSL